MLSFKQYLAQYPNGHKAKTKRQPLQKILKKRLSESTEQGPYQGSTMSKWDMIRLIADDPSETVLVELKKDSVVFSFVDVEVE
ncbi:MAG: hypothetical protein K9K68_05005 [Methylococcaceae bacterium]|nr:hypothetical protein [Methylococcaceae bacterium]